MAMYVGEGDWRSIAEQASKETDPAKLMTLVEKLCCCARRGAQAEVSADNCIERE